MKKQKLDRFIVLYMHLLFGEKVPSRKVCFFQWKIIIIVNKQIIIFYPYHLIYTLICSIALYVDALVHYLNFSKIFTKKQQSLLLVVEARSSSVVQTSFKQNLSRALLLVFHLFVQWPDVKRYRARRVINVICDTGAC